MCWLWWHLWHSSLLPWLRYDLLARGLNLGNMDVIAPTYVNNVTSSHNPYALGSVINYVSSTLDKNYYFYQLLNESMTSYINLWILFLYIYNTPNSSNFLSIEGKKLDPMRLHCNPSPKFEKMKWCYCGTTFPTYFVDPNPGIYSSQI